MRKRSTHIVRFFFRFWQEIEKTLLTVVVGGAYNRRIMHTSIKKYLHSFVAVPVLAASFALNPMSGALAKSPLAAVISSDKTGTLLFGTAGNPQSDSDQKLQSDLELKAAKVDAFFAKYDRPAEGLGIDLVSAARKYGLPDYSIAAVLQVESSGLAHACPTNKWNGFGYGSCTGQKFSSAQEAIETVAKTLAGQSDGSAQYYKNKDFATRLKVYNGYANSQYVPNINWVMNQMDNMQTDPAVSIASL